MKAVISCASLFSLVLLMMSCGDEEVEITAHNVEWQDHVNGTWDSLLIIKNIYKQGNKTTQQLSKAKRSISFSETGKDIVAQNFPLNATYEVSIVGKTIYFRSYTAPEFIFQDSEFSPSKLVFKQYYTNGYGDYIEETVYTITR